MTVPNRSRDWLRQAIHDLEQAEESRRAGRYDWACFAAQQAAEKAVKALHLHFGQEARGRTTFKLGRRQRFGLARHRYSFPKALPLSGG